MDRKNCFDPGWNFSVLNKVTDDYMSIKKEIRAMVDSINNVWPGIVSQGMFVVVAYCKHK
jgi:hypothetical protein